MAHSPSTRFHTTSELRGLFLCQPACLVVLTGWDGQHSRHIFLEKYHEAAVDIPPTVPRSYSRHPSHGQTAAEQREGSHMFPWLWPKSLAYIAFCALVCRLFPFLLLRCTHAYNSTLQFLLSSCHAKSNVSVEVSLLLTIYSSDPNQPPPPPPHPLLSPPLTDYGTLSAYGR